MSAAGNDRVTPARPLAGPRAAETPLILASGSAVRARLLSEAGVAFRREVAAVDEAQVKAALKAEGADATMAAETLAELKAQRVSRRHPDALVIGADQILDCGGTWFDKAVDQAAARATLLALRGRSHLLLSSVAVVRGGDRLWHRNERAALLMREFSDDFLDAYLAAAGDSALQSVGAYQLEGLGAQLFARIDGDYFTILGLPLLPLLDFLRNHGVVGR
ncbi:MAG TPA: Maf family protein [Alphaproteobacteria bacterium]|nr:Maf family protein [Alphaproteobacteria bacterium]